MLVAEVADPKKGDYIIDMCAAPGGKSLHVGDKMGDYGTVDARDVSQQKVDLIEENINRLDSINVQARVMDATVFDVDSELKCRYCSGRCALLRLWGDRQEAGNKVQSDTSEAGRNCNPAENDTGSGSRVCEARWSIGFQYLHHCKRRE